MTRDLELLFQKCASLTFEMQAFVESPTNTVGARRSVGSGMFVAPCQALTAKHVVRDMHNVHVHQADYLRAKTEAGYHTLPYQGMALQIVDVNDLGRYAEWGLTNVWPNPLTDLAVLQFAPVDETAVLMMNRMAPLFPKWSLLPPPVGETVVMLGQPRDPSGDPDVVSDKLTYIGQPAKVVANFERTFVRGLYDFPCFTVSHDVPHGMSGGPVFWNGLFCGVVSAGWGGQTVVASLWPVCLIQFQNPKLGTLDRVTTFESLFESKQIQAVDWDLVKGKVSHGDDDGKPFALLRPPE